MLWWGLTDSHPHPIGDPPVDQRIEQADIYSKRARFYEGESRKLRDQLEARTETLRQRAQRDLSRRPSANLDVKATTRAHAQEDTYLAEYSAGLNIVERRGTLYASMAADLRLAVMCDLLAAYLAQRPTE